MSLKFYNFITEHKKFIYFAIISVIVIIVVACYYEDRISNLNDQIVSLQHEVKTQKEITEQLTTFDKSEKATIINNYEQILANKLDEIKVLEEENDTLSLELETLSKENEELLFAKEELTALTDAMHQYIKSVEDKLSYYEEFEVFTYDTAGKRSDCDYELLSYLDSLIQDKPVNNLAFYCSWIMIESEWHTDCKNSTSTASGLPQFLSGTGKWVYEDLLENGKGTYTHSMVFDGKTSLDMMVAYVDKLMEQHKGNLNKVIDSYRGFHDTPYINRFNHYLSYFGTSIDEIASISKARYNEMSI